MFAFLFRNILLSLLLFSCCLLCGQEKEEYETEIDPLLFPQGAKVFVMEQFPGEQIHWLKEINGSESSFEAKLKFQGRKYSIEFDSVGRFQDVEFEIQARELRPEIIAKIKETLNKDFERCKWVKIQAQWEGTKEQVSRALKDESSKDQLQQNVEIVIYAREDKRYAYYEYLFDHQGVFISKVKLKSVHHDNFLY